MTRGQFKRGVSGGTRKVSAGIQGLYGDDLTKSSSTSNKKSLSDNRDRNNTRFNNIVVKRDDFVNERVSGFNRRNRVVSSINTDTGNSYDVSNSERFSGISNLFRVYQNESGKYEYKGFKENPLYAPKELAISLNDGSGYLRSNEGSIKRIVPTAPKPSNYSTPETMSPLFTPSNNERFSGSNNERFSGSRNEFVNRGWGSFYSNSPRVNSNNSSRLNGSYNSDMQRNDNLNRECKEMLDELWDKFSKKRR